MKVGVQIKGEDGFWKAILAIQKTYSWGYLNNETRDIDNVNKFKSAANEILIK